MTKISLLSGLYAVTVTVTEALALRPLLEDRKRITESIRILVKAKVNLDLYSALS